MYGFALMSIIPHTCISYAVNLRCVSHADPLNGMMRGKSLTPDCRIEATRRARFFECREIMLFRHGKF